MSCNYSASPIAISIASMLKHSKRRFDWRAGKFGGPVRARKESGNAGLSLISVSESDLRADRLRDVFGYRCTFCQHSSRVIFFEEHSRLIVL